MANDVVRMRLNEQRRKELDLLKQTLGLDKVHGDDTKALEVSIKLANKWLEMVEFKHVRELTGMTRFL